MAESDSPRSALIGSISVDMTKRSAMLSAYTSVSTRSTYQRRATPASACESTPESIAVETAGGPVFKAQVGSIAWGDLNSAAAPAARSKLHVRMDADGSRPAPVFQVTRLKGAIGFHIDDTDQVIVGEIGAEHAERPLVGHVSDRAVQQHRRGDDGVVEGGRAEVRECPAEVGVVGGDLYLSLRQRNFVVGRGRHDIARG